MRLVLGMVFCRDNRVLVKLVFEQRTDARNDSDTHCEGDWLDEGRGWRRELGASVKKESIGHALTSSTRKARGSRLMQGGRLVQFVVISLPSNPSEKRHGNGSRPGFKAEYTLGEKTYVVGSLLDHSRHKALILLVYTHHTITQREMLLRRSRQETGAACQMARLQENASAVHARAVGDGKIPHTYVDD